MLKLLLYLLPWVALIPAVTIVFADPDGRVSETAAELAALLLGGLAVIAVVYVTSEDSYRHDGTSVWTAYDVGGLAVAGIVAFVAAAVGVLLARARKVPGLVAFGLTLLAAFLSFAFVGATAN